MRSGKESRMARNILSVLVIWSFLFPALIGIGNSMVASAGEGPIEPNPSMIISGTYTTTDEFVLDENLVITGTGNFTVIGGGITVTPDYVHRWSITIQDGGSLNLIDSYLTVETDQIQPYLVLSVDVSGVFYCEKALLQFPGFVNVTGNGKMVMWDSEVSALIDIPSFVPDPTDWDFAPVFTINGNAEAHFYRSTIGYGSMFTTTDFDRNNATLGYMFDFNVEGDALVWLVDSYIGVDYESSPYTHNVLWAKDNAKVYGYNFTLDTDYQGDDRESAIRTAPPTAVVWLLRWANVSCLDNDSVPIEDVPLNPLLQPSLTPPTFPDTSTQTPHNYILNYLGKDQLTWKRTGPDGKVVLPLPTDKIDWTVDQTGPNSKFDGAYRIEGTYSGFTSSSNFSFRPYPAMDPLDGSQKVVLRFPVTVPKPDLIVSDITWDPAKLTEGENIDFTATVENQGGGSATGIYVKFYVDLQPLSNGSYIDRIDAGGSDQVTETWMNATGGGHSICVEVDFPRAISESNESNNILCKPFTIIHLRPDYEVLPGSITFPPKAYIGNPVRIDITVWNRGDIEAPENTVVVYEGDPDLGKKIGVAPVGTIPPGSTNSTFVEPVFNEPREYRICVVVDEDDAVVEKLETNNEACSILTVELAPNLAVSNNDIGIGNPCTREGEQATPQARIRNTGYIDAGPFRVDFYIDGVPFASGNSTGIAANSSEVIYSDKSWTPSTPGAHILRVEVDIDDSVKESTKADNIASKEILIFHEQMATTYTGDEELRVPATFNGSIDITGSLTIYGVDVEIRQRDMFKERFCIKVFGSGSLTLVDGARLFSNYPLVIYLTDSATLTVIGSDLVLDHEVHGDGGLYADQSSKIVMQTSSLYGDMFSTGDSVSLIGVDLLGSELYIETTSTSYIWDSEFVGVTDLSLLSDDGDLSTVDFDIRNVTFTQDLDSQLIFKGNQLVEFTSVELFTPTGEDPWTGMVTENAMVRFY
ncbi:MAG: CARDB domain-containing protein, partial [Thermoplasmata archaeon]